jgi:hypothetical protein
MATDTGSGLLALRDRAVAALLAHGPLSQDEVLRHVYGGLPPPALRAQLARPLLADPRLEQRPDGSWVTRGAPPQVLAPDQPGQLTVLALATSGPTPGRGRIVHLAARHVDDGRMGARFSAAVQAGVRLPRYVATRLGVEPDSLASADLPPFEALVADLVEFLGSRPILAQDVCLTWAYLEAELRRAGQILAPPLLLDLNELASDLLAMETKPTLARVAGQLGVPFGRIEHPDEEARVLGLVAPRLLERARARGAPLPLGSSDLAAARALPLRRGQTARMLPDRPGIYVMRDAEQAALYVGKARRLRQRVQTYVSRPLGATRRLEGLAGQVTAVDTAECASDLEALVLEGREIRRLQPRFNTVRQQAMPRTWLRLPPPPQPRPGRRQLAPRRLELASQADPPPADASSRQDDADAGPGAGQADPGAGARFCGPFRNEAAAEAARRLVRDVFELDRLRRGDPWLYEERLLAAWDFLGGATAPGVELVRARQQRAAATGDRPGAADCERQLRAIQTFDAARPLLPADPQTARYAVLRPAPNGIEGFILERGICTGYALLGLLDDEAAPFAQALLAQQTPRTTADDVPVVLRWLGAQRPTAQLVHLPSDALLAAEAIEDAVLAMLPDEASDDAALAVLPTWEA